MSRALEIFLDSHLREFTRHYLEAYPRAYFAFYKSWDGYEESFPKYERIIQENKDAIYRITAFEIQKYLNLYSIYAKESPDEFKISYYLGKAVDRFLQEQKLLGQSKVHLFAMLGLMDARLRHEGIDKELLRKNLARLIRFDSLWEELGETGGYLIFKCVSTTRKHTTTSA